MVAASVLLTTEPVKVIIFVSKLPEPSRTTILPDVLLLEMVANLALLIVASVISALTINDVDNNPAALLCTTPAVLNGSTISKLVTILSPTLIVDVVKLPAAVRLTIASATFALVEALARTVAAATLAAV